MKNRQALFLLSIAFIVILSSSAQAGTSHGVNGYVSDCGSGMDVENATVYFQLADFYGNFPAGYDSTDILGDTVGEYGNSNKSGWYAIEVGNFAKQWNVTDIVLINISKGDYYAETSVRLTNAGNDQAFTACLGNATNYSCACGNGVCEYWVPFCENFEFYVKGILTKRCPEDCANCSCGNGVCQWEECGENMVNCPIDCNPGYCGDGICQSEIGENQETCPQDCGYPGNGSCGNGDCEPEFGENWQTCPNDCYGAYAHCGDLICDGAETSDNCCLDCGCPESGKCHNVKCINNKCQKTCCLFGYCCVWLGLCWFWWVIIIIAIIIAIIIWLLTRPTLEKIVKALSRKLDAKNIMMADKASMINKLISAHSK